MDSDWFGSITGLPEKFIRFQMEVDKRSGYFFPDYRCQFTMVKDSCTEFFLPWVQHLFMKRNINLDWCFDPVSTTPFNILPAIPITGDLTASPLSWESIHGQSCLATSSGQKSRCPTILRRFWKLNCNFFSPSFQYHSPSKNEDWLEYEE